MSMLERMQPALKSLLNLENELRSAARNALIMRSDEAKAHMEEARRHYHEALASIRQEFGSDVPNQGQASTATQPNRDQLGPTGPVNVKRDAASSYEEQHPNAGTVGDAAPGPMPTHDPDGKASDLEQEIEKQRS